MAVNDLAEVVKENVKIPDYFDEIIVPSMEFYYNGNEPDFDARPVCCCPLHNEDTPSFRYYDWTNSYYCFGCGSGGDVIQLHREFMRKTYNREVSFREAVEFLYNQFVLGKKLSDRNIPKKIRANNPEIVESSNIAVMNYRLDRKRLEDRLLIDNLIPRNKKIKIYKALDATDKLLELKFISADDAHAKLTELEKASYSV